LGGELSLPPEITCHLEFFHKKGCLFSPFVIHSIVYLHSYGLVYTFSYNSKYLIF
jgi:hypothetical protein